MKQHISTLATSLLLSLSVAGSGSGSDGPETVSVLSGWPIDQLEVAPVTREAVGVPESAGPVSRALGNPGLTNRGRE